MKRMAIDMDEVLADTVGCLLIWLRQTYDVRLSRSDIVGKPLEGFLQPEQAAAMDAYLHQGDVFGEVPVMHGSQEVVRQLCDRYEVFVATAAMDYPRSCIPKFHWLRQHFPFIPPNRFVFCGDKSVVQADFLIDDSPRHFRRFVGTGILYDAPHNAGTTGYARVATWADVASRFLA